MPDEPLPSLDELRRQRELVANHLAWLDRQIAQRSAATLASRAPSATPAHPEPQRDVAPVADPDAILHQYQVEPTNVQRDVRRGCLLYFVIASVLLGAGVWLLYVALR